MSEVPYLVLKSRFFRKEHIDYDEYISVLNSYKCRYTVLVASCHIV
jgi:hypothetical protein